MDYSRPELADRLGAEYVAGTLRGPARRRFESLLPGHPALRGAVQRWQDRLMPLTATLAPVPPPARVWQRIETRLGLRPASAPVQAWWARLAFWRVLSGVATAATLALAFIVASPPPAQAPIVVVLSAAAPADQPNAVTPASFVASISADGRAMVTRPLTPVSVQADRSLELWALPPSGAPRSLGVISASGSTVVRRGQVLQGTAALAVTLEPPGGSPSGAPTGPVLYVGKLSS